VVGGTIIGTTNALALGGGVTSGCIGRCENWFTSKLPACCLIRKLADIAGHVQFTPKYVLVMAFLNASPFTFANAATYHVSALSLLVAS
jgi:hypothetical protein